MTNQEGNLLPSWLEVVSKPHLVSDDCVAIRFKMLTYFVYKEREHFKPNRRLVLEHILGF